MIKNIQRKKANYLKQQKEVNANNKGKIPEQPTKELFIDNKQQLYDCNIFWKLIVQNPNQAPKLNDGAMRSLLYVISRNEDLVLEFANLAINGILESEEDYFQLFKFFEALYTNYAKVIKASNKFIGLIKKPLLFEKVLYSLTKYKSRVNLDNQNVKSLTQIMENVSN